MRKFTYDMFDTITPPTLILSTKYHKHLGNIVNAQSVTNEFNMASHQEISFDVYKEIDGVKCELWDQLIDFKYLYVPEHNEYYELQVDIDETDKTVKHVVGVSASERELSQKYLRDFHVNDETDILRDDYVPTVFYNYQNPDASLLDRVLHDKGQSWTIEHVDSSIADIQRTFTADNTTIYDFLMNTVAKEIGCLFLFNSVNRTISAYDLKCKCNNPNCGFRGEFFDACPKCGSTNFTKGYGTYQNVFVASENFANQISVDGDADSVKNCFKIAGGDDLITATVANINPNRSNYIYRFSDDMLDDMPVALKNKLNDYNTLYQASLPTYQQYTHDYYEAVDDELYYHTKMMPETPMPTDTTAAIELAKIMSASFTVAVQNIQSVTRSSADLAVQNYAKVLIDPRYTVEVLETTLSPISGIVRTWTGKFKVTSLGKVDDQGNPDEATSDTAKTITINGNYEEFLQQKIQKALDRKDAAFITIFNIQSDSDFRHELTEYSLDRLNSFANSYQSVLEILIQQGVADVNASSDFYKIELYNSVYLPYYRRKGYIDDEIVVRQAEVDAAQADIDEANRQRRIIQNQLNLKNYLGDSLYEIFTLYLREDTYTNSNYISDGLDNAEIIDKARELFDVAESELYKASELQYSLSGTLANFLNTEEFKDIKDSFEIGDWIVCKADDKLYRLRLINLGYSYDSPTDMSVTFSNATRINNAVSDMADLFNKAESMATSYDYTAHQAEQGNKSKKTLDEFVKIGLDSSLYNILSGDNQEVTIDEHGITAKEFIDTMDDYSPEQLKVTNNIIAFTKDNWAHAALGLGKHDYKHYDSTNNTWTTDTDYGLSAQFVQAGWIYGSEIAAGQIYSSNYSSAGNVGTHIDLDNGTFNFAGQGFVYNGEDLTLGGFKVVTDGIVTNNISIYADGQIITDYMVGQVDNTVGEQYEFHGEIFNTYNDGALPWAKKLSINLTDIEKHTTGATVITPSSSEEIKMNYADDGNPHSSIFWINTASLVTNWKYLTFELETKTKTSGARPLTIGVSNNIPEERTIGSYSWWYVNWNKKQEITTENTTVYGNIDLQFLSGYKYIVVQVEDGAWKATLKKMCLTNFLGQKNQATGALSHAEGNGTKALSTASHAEGYFTQAGSYTTNGDTIVIEGDYAHSEGYCTNAVGSKSHAEGDTTTASSYGSHAEGCNTIASNSGAHAEGGNTNASGTYSHAEGSYTNAANHYAHSEGHSTNATGTGAHAEGYNTIAYEYSHAEGYNNNLANGYGAHAEGYGGTQAHGDGAHAEGCRSEVQNGVNYTAGHAEGYETYIYSSTGAHAEGYQTCIYDSDAAHAEGFKTVVGKFEHSTYTSADFAHAEGYCCRAEGDYSHCEGDYTASIGDASHSEGLYTEAHGYDSHSEGEYTKAMNNGSHSEGGHTIASGIYSHTQGFYTKATHKCQSVEGEFNMWDKSSANSSNRGNYVHIVGNGTHEYGSGFTTLPSENSKITVTCGNYGDMFRPNYIKVTLTVNGDPVVCLYDASYSTTVSTWQVGDNTPIEVPLGQETGNPGISDILDNGFKFRSGDSSTQRVYCTFTAGIYSNAYTLDWNGNAVYSGKLTVGANPVNLMDVATKQYVDQASGASDFIGATATTDGMHGLVIQPNAGDQDKFLRGDGTWAYHEGSLDFTGATASTDGTHGLVIQPLAGDQDKYLKGDGTWSTLPLMGGASSSVDGTSGLVPTPHIADKDKYLKGDGTWAAIDMPSVFTGATASTAGTIGTVPAPSAGYQTRYLSGDGNWERITTLENYYTRNTRPTTANVTDFNGLTYFMATSSMTTGKPPTDCHIIHTGWDANSAGGGAQLALAHGTNPRMWLRCQTGGVNGSWTGWYMIPQVAGSGQLTGDSVVTTAASGRLTASTVTATELSYLSGVTSAVQTQIDAKSEVSVNPITSTGTKIAEITVDGTTQDIYAPNGGGGGSSVIPNPQGTPTDVLSSVSIDNVIYAVSGNSGAITGTTPPTAQQGVNGSLYVQYDATDNSIKYVYCKINGVWSLFPFEYTNDAFVDGEGDSMTTSDGENLIFVD